MLALIDKGLWTYHQDLQLLGINIGTRMSLIEIREGELLAVSPIKFTDSVLRQVQEAGQIKWIIAPNPYHHLYVMSCKRAFPEATAFAPRSLISKRPDIGFQGVIEAKGTYPWDEAVETYLFEPQNKYSEVLLFHKASKSLIVTDYMFNLKPPTQPLARFVTKAMKIAGRPQMSRFMRFLARNPQAIDEANHQIKMWQPQRMIMAHGEIVEGPVAPLFD